MRPIRDTTLRSADNNYRSLHVFHAILSARISYYARKRSTVSLDWGGGGGKVLTQKDPVSLGSHANRLSSNLEAEISNYVIAQLSQTFNIPLMIVGISISSISFIP